MAQTLMLRDIVQLTGDFTQRADDQAVDTPVIATVRISTKSK